MSYFVFFCWLVICKRKWINYLGWGKRGLICLLWFTCNYVVSVGEVFFFLWMLGMGYVILLLHSLSLPYNYLKSSYTKKRQFSRTFAQ